MADYPTDQTSTDTPAQADEMTAEDTEKKEPESEGTTALLPKSILAGKEFNPGDEVVLKIVHLYDNEVEVAYATEEKPKEEGKSAMAEAEDSMGGYTNKPME